MYKIKDKWHPPYFLLAAERSYVRELTRRLTFNFPRSPVTASAISLDLLCVSRNLLVLFTSLRERLNMVVG